MYDSYGKFPPDGYFQENFWQIGSPSSCIEVNALEPNAKELHNSFKGRYCLIQPFRLPIPNGTWDEAVDELVPQREQTQHKRELPKSPPLLLPGNGIFDTVGVRNTFINKLVNLMK